MFSKARFETIKLANGRTDFLSCCLASRGWSKSLVTDEKPAAAVTTATPIKTEKPSVSEILARQMKIEQLKVKEEMKKLVEVEKKDKMNVLNVTPTSLQEYVKLMRWDKPAAIYLVYWPSAWAILGAASYLHHSLPSFYLLGLFAVGATTMRTAGCIINDMWDRNLDKKVERTKDRPLAKGTVGLPAATGLLAANLSVSLAVLLQLDLTTQILGACALFPVVIYPTAKRFTDWPQAILGMTFNWGALMGWSAVLCSSVATTNLSLASFLPVAALYAAGINWTLFYDTIYAHQDKEHDAKAGIKSTALTLEKKPVRWMLAFSSLTVSNLALFGYLTNQEPIFYITLGLAMAHFVKQIAFVNLKSPESCYKQFKSNNTVGALVAFGLLSSMLIK